MSRFMHDLNTAYTVYYNKKQKRVGPLLQGRYKAILVDKEPYLLELSRYIHLNPARAKVVLKAEEYQWSSYKDYLGIRQERWININYEWAKERLGKYWRERYKDFVEEGIDESSPLEKVKAGMLLGSEAFVDNIKGKISRQGAKTEVPSFKELKGPTIDEVVRQTSRFFNIAEKDILKKRRGFMPRKIALYLSRKCTFEKIETIGNRFNIGYAAVSKATSRIEEELRTEVEKNKIVGAIREKL